MNRSTKLLLASGAVAVPVTINAIIAARAGKMTQPLPGDIAYYDWIYGRVAFYRLGQGPPLLLVHNPNAGGSAWEWRKVFPEFANNFTVYALDLLGYGLSEKPNTPYTGGMYAELVHDFLEDVVGQPAYGIGSSLGATYLVNIAARRPELLHKLILVNPTGTTNTLPATARVFADGVLDSPLIGTSIYNVIVSKRNIEQELIRHIYDDPTLVTPDMVNFLHTSSHQRGCQHAAAAFISGKLDLPMRMSFTGLSQEILLIWGEDAHYTPVADAADLLYRDPQARLEIFEDCGMLPHDEKAGDFIRVSKEFLTGVNFRQKAA